MNKMFFPFLASALLLMSSAEGQNSATSKGIRRELETEAPVLSKQTKIAFLVGIGDYPGGQSGLNPLKYPVSDVGEVNRILSAQGYMVSVMTDRSATASGIRSTFQELAKNVEKSEGSFIFFFSGHGFQDKGENYLATYGTQAAHLENQGLSVKEVQMLLAQTGARQRMAFIDACRNDPSGSKSMNTAGPRSFADLKPSEGLRVLYSTAPGQFSYEDDNLQEGVFTHFLVEGMQGKAAGSDGMITFDDVKGYVTKEMRRYGVEHGRAQIPYQSGEASGDFLLATRQELSAAPAVTATKPQGTVPVPRQPQPIPVTPSPVVSSGTGQPTFADTERHATLVSGAKLWRSSVDNQIYRMDFDAQNLVIKNRTGQIIATLELKPQKKTGKSIYEGQLARGAAANTCGTIQVVSWGENRIDGRVDQPVRQSNGQMACGNFFGLRLPGAWASWTWIAEQQ